MQGNYSTSNNPAFFGAYPLSQRRSGSQSEPVAAGDQASSVQPPQANGVNITINYPQTTVANGGAVSSPSVVGGSGAIPSSSSSSNQADTFNRQQGISSNASQPSATTPLDANGQPISGAAASGNSVNNLSTSVQPGTETPQGHLIQIYERLNDAYRQASEAQQTYLQLRDNYLNQAQAYTQLATQMNDQAYGQYNGQAGAQPQTLPMEASPRAFPGQVPQAALMPAFDPAQQQTQGFPANAAMMLPQSQQAVGDPSQQQATPPAAGQGFSPEQLRQMIQDPAVQAQAMQLAQKVDPAQLQAMLQDPSVQQLLQQVSGVPAAANSTGGLPDLSSTPASGATVNPQNNGGPAGLPPQGFMA